MNPSVKSFSDPHAVATAFASSFYELVCNRFATQSIVTVALSGGTTPKLFFTILADDYRERIDWSKVHFFWADERCVPPTSAESNFGMSSQLLFSKIDIPPANIHRVLGEADPASERARYQQEIERWVGSNSAGLPEFDLIMLGIGDDGHTASIFPDQFSLMTSELICDVATHPESGQHRITLTGPVLNSGKDVVFLVTGKGKADILAEIMGQTGSHLGYPAAAIVPATGVTFFVDVAALDNSDIGQ